MKRRALITAPLVVGSAAEALVERRGHGEALAILPHAARALDLAAGAALVRSASRSMPAPPMPAPAVAA